MNLDKEKYLEQQLDKWRDERGFSMNYQQEILEIDLCEELTKYYKAKNEFNDFKKVDSLCNIYVLCMNSMEYTLDEARKNVTNRCKYTNFNVVLGNFLDCFNTQYNLYKMMLCVENMVEKEGFDFYECMVEKIKEMFNSANYEKCMI